MDSGFSAVAVGVGAAVGDAVGVGEAVGVCVAVRVEVGVGVEPGVAVGVPDGRAAATADACSGSARLLQAISRPDRIKSSAGMAKRVVFMRSLYLHTPARAFLQSLVGAAQKRPLKGLPPLSAF